MSDKIAYGEFEEYKDIKQIEILFYSGKWRIRNLDELRGEPRITITDRDKIISFMQKLNDFEGRIGEAEKLLTHGICIVRLKRTFTYFYFDLYENSVYVQPPSFKNEIGGHGQANTKIFDTLFQLFQGKPRDLPLRLDK